MRGTQDDRLTSTSPCQARSSCFNLDWKFGGVFEDSDGCRFGVLRFDLHACAANFGLRFNYDAQTMSVPKPIWMGPRLKRNWPDLASSSDQGDIDAFSLALAEFFAICWAYAPARSPIPSTKGQKLNAFPPGSQLSTLNPML